MIFKRVALHDYLFNDQLKLSLQGGLVKVSVLEMHYDVSLRVTSLVLKAQHSFLNAFFAKC